MFGIGPNSINVDINGIGPKSIKVPNCGIGPKSIKVPNCGIGPKSIKVPNCGIGPKSIKVDINGIGPKSIIEGIGGSILIIDGIFIGPIGPISTQGNTIGGITGGSIVGIVGILKLIILGKGGILISNPWFAGAGFGSVVNVLETGVSTN
jgi:hypothetical protein